MFDCTQWAFAYDKPLAIGSIKNAPEDFKVHELLGFELTGEGEHLFLQIEKRGLNTEELAKALAHSTNRPYKAISYAGIKDRHAVTTQWLSIHCPGEDIPDANSLRGNGWHVMTSKRHLKKLKTGALSGNHFQLVIRDIHGADESEARLQKIKQHGVPNYFGMQRFGYDGQNLLQAQRLLLGEITVKNRFLRGIYYSAMRSFLFNHILSERVNHRSWNKAIPGDVMQLAGKNSIFSIATPDDLINARLQSFDISPAACLWGIGKELATDLALMLQKKALRDYDKVCELLELHKLERSYRAQVLPVNDMVWQWQEGALLLSFKLPAGSYATSVIRELFDVT